MSERLAIIVADDEPLARQLVARLAAEHAGPHTITECGNGDELASALVGTRADVLFLDVRMPGRDVFDVLAEHARASPSLTPAVVFTTAYERYAVRAFELNAADYLVKPLTAGRFATAMRRARQRVADRAATADLVGRVALDLGSRPSRLLVPERGRMVPIDVSAVDWIHAEGDYARLHVGAKSYLVTRGLSDLERRLDPDRFVRIHRSAIVNADRIAEVKPEGSSRYSLRLSDGTRLVVSRSGAERLRRWRV